jgi:hypothetical protein
VVVMGTNRSKDQDVITGPLIGKCNWGGQNEITGEQDRLN